ncbi:MAG: serine/threonine protein kinase [Myxococcota bacterium]|jgi:serine/threonine-protein kinase|nr:serine/threonine protein kinase [Myxococcota bacterium]
MSTADVTRDEGSGERAHYCPACDGPVASDASACACGATGPFPVDPWIGAYLEGRHRLVRRLAAGGFGMVFAARHVEAGLDLGPVAVKLIRHPDRSDARRFLEEAALARKVRSPHLLEVFSVGVHEGRPYVVTPLLEGRTLRELLEDGDLTPARARIVVRQLLVALRALHRAGLVHRDVKPSNVFVGPDDFVTLFDFGIARDVARLQAGLATRAGTPGYMAPEQLAGAYVDGRADVYAVGVVWLELLAAVERAPASDRALAESFTAELGRRPTVDAALARIDGSKRRYVGWLGAMLLLLVLAAFAYEGSRTASPAPVRGPVAPAEATRSTPSARPTSPASPPPSPSPSSMASPEPRASSRAQVRSAPTWRPVLDAP